MALMAKKRKLKNPIRACLTCLLLVALLCGCGAPRPANAEPSAAPQESPSPTPTPDPETLAREQRLKDSKDGFLWEDGYLLAIDKDGNLRTDCYIGVLHFGKDGRYTSGDEELDALVAEVVAENTDSGMTRMEMLRAMYDYTMEHITYVGFANYECSFEPAHGKDGWMPEWAIRALKDGVGNCYCYAAAYAALARGVGFQAYAVGGVVSAMEDPHGWVQILDEDGNMWMNDPEIEYRFGTQWKLEGSNKTAPDLFYKSEDMIGAETGFSYRAQCDPYAAEAKEAEARANGTAQEAQIAVKNPTDLATASEDAGEELLEPADPA